MITMSKINNQISDLNASKNDHQQQNSRTKSASFPENNENVNSKDDTDDDAEP